MNQHEFWKDYLPAEETTDTASVISPLMRQLIDESGTQTAEAITAFNEQITPPSNPLWSSIKRAFATANPLGASIGAAAQVGIHEGILPDPIEIAKNLPGSFERMGSGILDIHHAIMGPENYGTPGIGGLSDEARERAQVIRESTKNLIGETGRFAVDLATRTPGDIVSPLQTTKDYPTLTVASQGIADTTPFGEGGWRGMIKRGEADPAEWITELALEATGFGLGAVGAKRALRGTLDALDAITPPSAIGRGPIPSRIAQAQTAQHHLYGGVAGGGTPSPKQLAKAESELETLPSRQQLAKAEAELETLPSRQQLAKAEAELETLPSRQQLTKTESELETTPKEKSGYTPTPEQAAVIAHREGYGRVAAGPGAGKTGTLAARVQSMTEEDIDPQGILTLAFNREAAKEFSKRTGGQAPAKTLHAFSYEVLKERQARLDRKTPRISNKDFASFMREQDELSAINTYKSQGTYGKETMRLERDKVSEITREYESARQNVTEGVFDVETLSEEARPYARAYETQKRERGEIDFQDSLIYAGQALDTDAGLRKTFQERYPYVQVDEFQDVSESDWRILKNLSPNLLGVGDIDQGIYGGLRGGTGDVMRRLEGNVGRTSFADYMKTVDEDPNLFVRATHPSEDTLKQQSIDVPLTTGYHKAGMPDDFTLPKDAFWQSQPGTPSYEGSFHRGGTFGYKKTQELYESDYLDPYPSPAYGGPELRIASGKELETHKYAQTPEVVFEPKEVINKFNIDDFMEKERDVFINEATGGILPPVQQYQLTQNFRSTPEIIAGSRQLIQRNPDRIDLDLQATRSRGVPIRQLRTQAGISNAFDDSPQTYRAISTEIEPGQETAILTRTNEELRQMRTGLTQELGEQALRSSEAKSGIILTGVSRSQEIKRLGIAALSDVEFSTVHKAKGREWDKVLLKFNTEAGETNFPHIRGDLEEERRLAYVGMTRAKDELVMMGESRFIDEAQRNNWGNQENLEPLKTTPEPKETTGFFQKLKDTISNKKTAGAIGIGASAHLLGQDSEASENRMILPFGMSFSIDKLASQIYQKTPAESVDTGTNIRATPIPHPVNQITSPQQTNLDRANAASYNPGGSPLNAAESPPQTFNQSSFRLPNINAEKSFYIPSYQTYTEGGLRSVPSRYQSTQARISPIEAIINSQFEGKAHQSSLETKIEKLAEKQDELIDEVRESKHLTQAEQKERISGIQERYGHLIGQQEWSLENLRADQSIGNILKETGTSFLRQTGQKLLQEQITQPATDYATQQIGNLLGLGAAPSAAGSSTAATAAAPSALGKVASAATPLLTPLALAAGTFYLGEKSLDSGWDPDSVRFPEGTSHSQQVSEYHMGKRSWEKPAATESPADKELWIVSQIENIFRSVLQDTSGEISNQAVTALGRKLTVQKDWGTLS